MNLLLLLSALLSACTGVLVGGGPAAAPLAVSRGPVDTGAAVAVVPAAATRPPNTVVPIAVNALLPVSPARDFAAPQPIYASRRRE